MKTGIPSGLQGLLVKVGLAGQKAAEAGVDAKALTAEPKEAKGLEKGTALGDGTLLAGLGFSAEDRRSAIKNAAERANIDRFMQDPTAEVKELQQALRDAKEGEGQVERREAREGVREEKDPSAQRELKEEVRRDEKREEVREQAKEPRDQRDRESAEAKERERERNRDDEREDERDKHGQGWVQEELEEREEKKRRGALREDDALGAHTRCRGHQEDGSSCLRRPVPGTPYCRGHQVPAP